MVVVYDVTSQLVDIVVQHFGTLATSMVADYIRTRPQERTPAGAPILPPAASGDNCPVCRAHREAAEAMALMEGLAGQVERSGELPAGLGGTVPLARRCLEEARDSLVAVAASFPDLHDEVRRADGVLAAAQSTLSGTLAPSMVPSVARQTREAWQSCYELARLAFAPAAAPAAQDDPLLAWVHRVRATDMTDDEAIAALKGVLDGHVDGG